MWPVLQGHDHMHAYNEWSLIETGGTGTTRWHYYHHGITTTHKPSQGEPGRTYLQRMVKTIRLLSRSKHLLSIRYNDLSILAGYNWRYLYNKVIRQQRYKPTPTYLMHISQELSVNKDFINTIEGWDAPGLTFIAEKVSFLKEIQ
jgi:hypothetical protein